MWTPVTSNIVSEGGGDVGFLWQILCVMEREGKVTDFPHSQFQVPSVCGMLGKQNKTKQKSPGALKRHDSSHSGWRGRTPRETDSSTKCQMRNIGSAVSWQRSRVT